MKTSLYFCIFLYIYTSVFACEIDTIKNQLANFHGPQWPTIIPPCSKSQIKLHLQKIIQNPAHYLKEYQADQQAYLYRNAVKSYGHFGENSADVDFLSDLYHDPRGDFKKYFGDESRFAKLTIFESLANTGHPDALLVFQKILEYEDSPLFHQNSVVEFAQWVLDGVPDPLLHDHEGSKVYSEAYFPNIMTKASIRFLNQDEMLLMLEERREQLKKTVEAMLSNPQKYQKLSPALNALKESLSSDEKNEPLPKINSEKNFREPKSEAKAAVLSRKPSSAENKDIDEKDSFPTYQYLVLIFLALLIGFVIYLRGKRP